MKIGYTEDWTGASTERIQIIDETISGKYVCKKPGVVFTRPDGSKYLCESLTGLFLKDKTEVSSPHEEEELVSWKAI